MRWTASTKKKSLESNISTVATPNELERETEQNITPSNISKNRNTEKHHLHIELKVMQTIITFLSDSSWTLGLALETRWSLQWLAIPWYLEATLSSYISHHSTSTKQRRYRTKRELSQKPQRKQPLMFQNSSNPTSQRAVNGMEIL